MTTKMKTLQWTDPRSGPKSLTIQLTTEADWSEVSLTDTSGAVMTRVVRFEDSPQRKAEMRKLFRFAQRVFIAHYWANESPADKKLFRGNPGVYGSPAINEMFRNS